MNVLLPDVNALPRIRFQCMMRDKTFRLILRVCKSIALQFMFAIFFVIVNLAMPTKTGFNLAQIHLTYNSV